VWSTSISGSDPFKQTKQPSWGLISTAQCSYELTSTWPRRTQDQVEHTLVYRPAYVFVVGLGGKSRIGRVGSDPTSSRGRCGSLVSHRLCAFPNQSLWLRCPATLSSSRILTHRGESGPRQTQASYEGVGRMFQSPKRKTATLLHTDTCLRNLHTRYSFVRSCNSVIRLLHARSELNTRSE
jgi:hypothetical protein